MGVGEIPKLGTCELFFSFTDAFDQLLGIEVPQASKTSVHCCYVQPFPEHFIIYNIPA